MAPGLTFLCRADATSFLLAKERWVHSSCLPSSFEAGSHWPALSGLKVQGSSHWPALAGLSLSLKPPSGPAALACTLKAPGQHSVAACRLKAPGQWPAVSGLMHAGLMHAGQQSLACILWLGQSKASDCWPACIKPETAGQWPGALSFKPAVTACFLHLGWRSKTKPALKAENARLEAELCKRGAQSQCDQHCDWAPLCPGQHCPLGSSHLDVPELPRPMG